MNSSILQVLLLLGNASLVCFDPLGKLLSAFALQLLLRHGMFLI